MPIRKYPLIKDTTGLPVFGGDDGTRFYGIKPYNTYTVGNTDSDDGTGYFAELGVKDNDLANLVGLVGGYILPTGITNSPSTDLTVTFSTQTVKQVLIDNQGNTNPVYVEYADSAASTTSPRIVAGGKELVPVYTNKIHIYSVTPTSVVIRGWY